MDSSKTKPNVPVGIYLEQDEQGEPRVVVNTTATDAAGARLLVRFVGKL